MSWLRAHPHAAIAAFVGLFLILGAFIVESRTSVTPGDLSVWGGNGAPLLNPTSYAPETFTPEAETTTSSGTAAPVYIPPPTIEGSTENEQFDFESFLASLIEPKGTGGGSVSADLELAYAFIPQGLVAEPKAPAPRTPEQQKLYAYGNEVGSYIQTYEDANRNAAVALRDQAEDRQNQQKNQAVKLIAGSLRNVGENLLDIDTIPPAVSGLHKALAESYIDVGRKLAAVPDASGDAAFVSAIEAYNASADTLVKNYIALAGIFSISGVTFSEQDPGSIFTFSANAGL